MPETNIRCLVSENPLMRKTSSERYRIIFPLIEEFEGDQA
jgi:hypothetical protein